MPDSFAGTTCEVGVVVVGVAAVTAEIDDLVAGLGQAGGQLVLEGGAPVVRSQGHAHRSLRPPSVGASGEGGGGLLS